MMTKEGSTKIVNFMTPGAGVLVLGRGHISHFSEYVVSSTLSIYSTLIAIVLRDNDAAFRYHSWFSFILWWGCWYTNMSPFDKTPILRWPLRPVGLLFCLVVVNLAENSFRGYRRAQCAWEKFHSFEITIY